MKKKRFSVEQIVGVLKQAQVGVPVAEVIRKAGISEQTFYRWRRAPRSRGWRPPVGTGKGGHWCSTLASARMR